MMCALGLLARNSRAGDAGRRRAGEETQRAEDTTHMIPSEPWEGTTTRFSGPTKPRREDCYPCVILIQIAAVAPGV